MVFVAYVYMYEYNNTTSESKIGSHTVRNDGTQPAPANIPIVFTIDGIRYGQVTTMAELQPGEEVTLSAELGISALEAGQTLGARPAIAVHMRSERRPCAHRHASC